MEDSQKLAIAATLGELSLALRRSGEAVIANAKPLRTGDFLGGGGGSGAPRAAASGPRRAYSAILIIEGEPSKRTKKGAAPTAAGAPAAAPAFPSLQPTEDKAA